jgi:hypothetical protein
MSDLIKMRRGVLKELKNVHKFLDNMERSVRANNPLAIQRAYMFLVHMVREMEEGLFTPTNIALDVSLAQELQQLSEEPTE